MTDAMRKLFSGDAAPGIYTYHMSLRPTAICGRAHDQGWVCAYLNGAQIHDKDSLLEHTAKALTFPAYFGRNWDALEECITEPGLFDAAGCLLLYDHAAVIVAQRLEVWNTYYDILSAAVEYWRSRERAFCVILRNAGHTPQRLPAL